MKKRKKDSQNPEGEAKAGDEALPADGEAKKSLPVKVMAISAASAIAMGAAAAGAAYLLAPGSKQCDEFTAGMDAQEPAKLMDEDVAFLNLEPLVVTLGPGAKSRYLKISLSLETNKNDEERLNELSPRIRDTLNTYLRAVEEDDLVKPAGMTRLRAQMLRRLQLVAPGQDVRDVLITDFVLT